MKKSMITKISQNKLYFIVLFALLGLTLLSQKAYSSWPNPDIWYKFENNADNSGTLSSYSGIKGAGCSYVTSDTKQGSYALNCTVTGAGNNGIFILGTWDWGDNNHTICAWVKKYSTTQYSYLIGNLQAGDTAGQSHGLRLTADMEWSIYGRGGATETDFSIGVPDLLTYNHYCFVNNITNVKNYRVFVNGTEQYTSNNVIALVNVTNKTNYLNTYGSYSPTNGLSILLVDDWQYYNESLTNTQILEIYRGIRQFEITAKDFSTGSFLTIINTTIFNGTDYLNFTSTNGTLVTSFLTNYTNKLNISVNAPAYLESSYLNYNISYLGNLIAELNKSNFLLNVSAYSSYSGSLITDFQVNISRLGFSINQTASQGSTLFDVLGKQNYTLIINATGYTTKSATILLNKSFQSYNFSLDIISWTGAVYCNSSINSTSVNFTIYDEDYNLPLNADIAGTVAVTDYGFINTNFSFNFTSTDTFKLCIYPQNASYSANIYVEYETNNGYKERYYVQNMSLTNVTQYVRMYNFNTTSTTSTLDGTIVDSATYGIATNIIAKMRRFYPATNEWRQVQIDKSDESGKVIFYVHEKDTLYDFIFERNNVNLYTTQQMKFICTAGVCDVTFPITITSFSSTRKSIIFGINYNNATKVITTEWNDPTGLTQTVWVEIVKETPRGIVILSNQSATSTSGSLSYDATGQEGLLIVRAYSSASPWTADAIAYIEMQSRKLFEIISQNTNIANGQMEAGFWSFGVILTTTFASLFNPFAGLMGLSLGLVAIYFLVGFNFLTITFLVSLGILIIYAAWKVKQ